MEEAEVNSETQEVATHEAENQTPQEESQTETWKQKQERNWQATRQKIADLERQNQQKEEVLRQMWEMQQAQKKQQVPEEPSPDPDEYASYSGVQKVTQKTVAPLQKDLEQLKSELAAAKQRELFATMRQKYADYDDVVNPETIALFEEKEPELSQSIAAINDPYKMTLQAYKFIKSSGILEEVPGKRRQKEATKMLEKNSKTIQSPQAYDKRPMAQAFKLTEKEKSNLWDEMNQYASMASSAAPLQ